MWGFFFFSNSVRATRPSIDCEGLFYFNCSWSLCSCFLTQAQSWNENSFHYQEIYPRDIKRRLRINVGLDTPPNWDTTTPLLCLASQPHLWIHYITWMYVSERWRQKKRCNKCEHFLPLCFSKVMVTTPVKSPLTFVWKTQNSSVFQSDCTY